MSGAKRSSAGAVLRFESPELRDELAEAIKVWKGKIRIARAYEFSEDVVDVTDPDFDPAAHPDRLVTYGSEFDLGLPEWEDSARITYGEFIELARELSEADLVENRECRTDRRYLLRVSAANDQTVRYLLHTLPDAETETESKLQEEYVERAREDEEFFEKVGEITKVADDREDERFDEALYEAWKQGYQRRHELERALKKPALRYCTTATSIDGHDITCSLTEGFTMFAVAVAASGDYDKDWPPVAGDLFVEVRYRRPISRDTARYVADSYLFELSSTLGLAFEVDPRPTLKDEDYFYSRGELRTANVRLRPLLLSKGMPELLRLYNRALGAPDHEVGILYFAKVIEYVSQTVVGQQATEAIRAKLLSPRSLSPDAAFIAELQAVLEEQRVFRKDREAMKQAIMTCCEASELAGVAPPFLVKLRGVSPSDKPKKQEEALAQFGYSLSATRNAVAHAKSNYEPTGEECPEDQLAEFDDCAKLAAEQAIRWYHSRPEEVRVL